MNFIQWLMQGESCRALRRVVGKMGQKLFQFFRIFRETRPMMNGVLP